MPVQGNERYRYLGRVPLCSNADDHPEHIFTFFEKSCNLENENSLLSIELTPPTNAIHHKRYLSQRSKTRG